MQIKFSIQFTFRFAKGMQREVNSKSIRLQEKKEEIWLSPMTNAPISTEKSKKQHDNTKTLPITSISQRLRNDLGRSVGVTAGVVKAVYQTSTFLLTATAL